MAMHSRIGSLMRQTISQTTISSEHVTGSSMLNAFRSISTKLFVGGLSNKIDDHALEEAFSRFGSIYDARVIYHGEFGKSRGYGFVHFNTDDSAKEAIAAMDGQELNGRSIRVSYARDYGDPMPELNEVLSNWRVLI